jgi:hypothetical protein
VLWCESTRGLNSISHQNTSRTYCKMGVTCVCAHHVFLKPCVVDVLQHHMVNPVVTSHMVNPVVMSHASPRMLWCEYLRSEQHIPHEQSQGELQNGCYLLVHTPRVSDTCTVVVSQHHMVDPVVSCITAGALVWSTRGLTSILSMNRARTNCEIGVA